MIELYYKINFWVSFVIPIVFLAVLIVVVFTVSAVSVYKENRIKRYFEKNGYTRYLVNVSSCGRGEFWAGRKTISLLRI